MSLPTEADFALIKIGDGESSETFAAVCGIQNAAINFTVNTADRFVRDCAKPGEVPNRRVKVTGKQCDITGAGFTDKAGVATLQAALGVSQNYEIELYQDDGTDAGTLLGTIALAAVMTAHNMSIPRDGDATAEITIASDGAWTWTAES